MTSHEYILDDIANMPPRQNEWEASLALGKYISHHMDFDNVEGHDRHYWLANMHDTICGISEQPDLDGEITVVLHRGEGTWNMEQSKSNQEMPTFVQRAGRYIGFYVGNEAATETLMQVVLPLNKETAQLLQHGSTTSFSFAQPQREIMQRYDARDLALNPRRIQVAAQLMRTIVTSQIPARPSMFKTAEEQEAFQDKHFPYRDVPLTGGGGKTVRMRVAGRFS